MENYICIGTVV